MQEHCPRIPGCEPPDGDPRRDRRLTLGHRVHHRLPDQLGTGIGGIGGIGDSLLDGVRSGPLVELQLVLDRGRCKVQDAQQYC